MTEAFVCVCTGCMRFKVRSSLFGTDVILSFLWLLLLITSSLYSENSRCTAGYMRLIKIHYIALQHLVLAQAAGDLFQQKGKPRMLTGKGQGCGTHKPGMVWFLGHDF